MEFRNGITKSLFAVVIILLVFALAAPAAAKSGIGHAPTQVLAETKQKVLETYGNLPIRFEANQGQADRQVKFLSRGRGFTLFLTATEAVLTLSKPQGRQTAESHQRGARPEGERKTHTAVLRMKLVGANQQPRVAGLEELPGKVNYFLGNDPNRWRTNVPTYARVEYRDVYPGVNLVYYGNQQQLEYDFVVAPGADPAAIRLALSGAQRLRTDTQGDLIVKTATGELRMHKPRIYQEVNDLRQEISGGYVLNPQAAGANPQSEIRNPKLSVVSFQVAAYDASRPLVIDPVLSYSTYLGGSGDDYGSGIAVDAPGNTYLTGNTASADFPTGSPFQGTFRGGRDVFVTKLDATGSSIVYSTYLGGSGDDVGSGIAVDTSGNAYLFGHTASTDFPTVNPFQTSKNGGYDAFVAKLDATGSSLFYSTYLGGSSEERGNFGIALDASGNVYVSGYTTSTDFPTTSGAFQSTFGGDHDAFVTKLDPSRSGAASLVYSTYLGGSGQEINIFIAVDASGNAYVSGRTTSTNFPTTPGAFQPTFGGGDNDVFVTKLNATGSALIYSTYLGGGGSPEEESSGIAVDASGNAYVVGFTPSTNFPTTPGAFQPAHGGGTHDAFVTKFNATGSALIYSTYLGGSGGDYSGGIAVDSFGKAYVSGATLSTNFPTKNPLQPNNAGGRDAFVAKLDPSQSGAASLVYSTYLGGSGSDSGGGIVVDASGNAYLMGYTSSTDFPTTPGAFQPGNHGGIDTFVAKITEQPPPPLAVVIDIKPGSFPNSINLGSGGTVPVAILSSATFDATTVDPTTVTLASAPVKLKGKGTPMAAFQDVNGDGLQDLVVHVMTEALQLSETDTEAVLEGKTFGGIAIRGTDSVRVVP